MRRHLCQLGAPDVRNCTIVNNFPGGLFTNSWDGMSVTNTILWGNDRYQIYAIESAPTITFCDVQGGYPGQGNINMDPSFLKPSGGFGAEYDGAAATWTLRSSSPCINAGTQVEGLVSTDLAGAERVHSGVIDLGAYENPSDLPLMTATPAAAVDAGFVSVDASATTTVELSNTGKLSFIVMDATVSNGPFSLVAPIYDKILAPGESVPGADRLSADAGESVHGHADRALDQQQRPGDADRSARRRDHRNVRGRRPGQRDLAEGEQPLHHHRRHRVAKDKTLIIEPGVIVKFAGHYGLTVGYRATPSRRRDGAGPDSVHAHRHRRRLVRHPLHQQRRRRPAEALYARARHEAPHRRGQL